MLRFAILGSGAVGGYHGARLARAGHDVTFIARGAHLAAIRERGLEIRSPALGGFTVRARAEEDTSKVGPVDVVIVAVKAYDNATALPLVAPLLGPGSSVLTLQNGVDSVNDLAARIGEEPVIGGTTYIATALGAPGVIEQTGTHRRIVFGEVFGRLPRLSPRVQALHEALAGADIQSEAVGDGRVPIWEKFIFLVALAGFTGARGCRSARCGPTRKSDRSSSTPAARSSASRGQKACRSLPTSSIALPRTSAASPARCGRRC